MKRKNRSNEVIIVLFFIATLLLGISIGRVLFPIEQTKIQYKQKVIEVDKNKINHSMIYLLAINREGYGEAIPLYVEVKPGTGKVLANIDNLLFWVDTQHSIQVARDLAANITGRDPNTFDVIYTIKTNSTVVGGESAGAAFTIATIAALTNRTLNNSILITGTINPDGSIGQVGGVVEKAFAAKRVGAEIFLVPEGEGKEVKLVPVENCVHPKPGFTFCEIKYQKKEIDISKKVGIKVREVKNIYDAMKYFFNG